MEIEVVLDAGATIGESPTWASAESALYWIDVKKPALYRYDPATGGQLSWLMPSDIGAFGLVSDPPGAVVALRQGIFRLDFASGSLTQLAPPPFDPALFRFNEGACDTAGRFWVGVMFDPLDDAVPPATIVAAQLHSARTACAPNRIPPNCITAWRGVPTVADSICHIAIDERCSPMRSTRQAAGWACAISSHRFRRLLVCPMARPSTPKAGIGAHCMAAADCGGIRRRARSTGTLLCR